MLTSVQAPEGTGGPKTSVTSAYKGTETFVAETWPGHQWLLSTITLGLVRISKGHGDGGQKPDNWASF